MVEKRQAGGEGEKIPPGKVAVPLSGACGKMSRWPVYICPWVIGRITELPFDCPNYLFSFFFFLIERIVLIT